MQRFGIISNPFSKINKQNPDYNAQLCSALGSNGLFKVTTNLEELFAACEEFKVQDIDLIGIVGGDGSISVVLSAIFKAYGPENLPKILVLRGGTINFLAQNLGINRDALECLKDSLASIKNNTLFEKRFSTLQIKEQLGFIFANGMASRFLEEFYKNKSNSAGVFYLIGRTLVDGFFRGKISGLYSKITKAEPMEITITSEENDFAERSDSGHYTLILAATIPKMPYGVPLFKNISGQNFCGEMISVSIKGKKLLQGTLQAAFSKTIGRHGIETMLFQRACISCKQNSSYSLDGELFCTEDGQIDIKIGPQFVFCSPYKAILD